MAWGRIFAIAFVAVATSVWAAEPLTEAQKGKIEAKLVQWKAWGTAPEVIAGIKAAPPAWAATMTQDKWTALSVLSPEVKDMAKNDLANWLRAQKDPVITEVFVNRADGTKAAFLSKTTNWNHTGKAKHDVPMSGKTWMGEIETDESTGLKQVQVSFPVLDGKKVIGTIVIGVQISKL